MDDEIMDVLKGRSSGEMTYVIANTLRMKFKKYNGTLDTSTVRRKLERLEKDGKVKRVRSCYARQICWAPVEA